MPRGSPPHHRDLTNRGPCSAPGGSRRALCACPRAPTGPSGTSTGAACVCAVQEEPEAHRGEASVAELRFRLQLICLQVVALRSRGLCELRIPPPPKALDLSEPLHRGPGGLRGLRSRRTTSTVGTGHLGTGATRTPPAWAPPPHPHQLTQFPRTVTLKPSTGTRGNAWLLFRQQPPKMEQPPTPHSIPQFSSGSGPWAQHPQETIPLPGAEPQDAGPLTYRLGPGGLVPKGPLPPLPPPGPACRRLSQGAFLNSRPPDPQPRCWASSPRQRHVTLGWCLRDHDLPALSPAYAGRRPFC